MSHTSEISWVCYYRVSTARQGESGLGLDAQRSAVAGYIQSKGGTVIAEFTETESGKKAANRPQLQAALELCRKRKATLIIAKLDRLARNVHFISGLLEAGVDFVAVDQPTKDRFMLHIQAAVAEHEIKLISDRTKAALAAAKERGVEIGATGRTRAVKLKVEATARARELAPLFLELHAQGFVQVRQIRDELNRRGIPSPGGAKWHLPTVHKTMSRHTASPADGGS